tara:strand:+ start:578 stop:1240 length:663 start_codon:yes stop_codon:yes gene_type:complete
MAEEYVISVVLEGNASSLKKATDEGAKGQGKLKKSTQEANIEFLAQVARYQAMTAALNQTIGGLNKMAGALDKLGFKEQGEFIRKYTAVLELAAGPAEIYLAYLTLSIAMGMKDAKTKDAQAGATTKAATAQAGLNAAMKANPLIAIISAIILVIVFFALLEKKFGLVTKMVDGFNNSLESMEDHFMKIVNFGKGVISVLGTIGSLTTGRGMAKLVAGAR